MFRSVRTGFWTDSKVLDEFTPEDKYFYLYLFTNPHTNLAGCYEISIKQIVTETGYSRETVENLIKRFVEVHNVIRYEPTTKEILLINWHKHNWTSSEKYRKALKRHIDCVKCSNFKDYLTLLFEKEGEADTVSIPYAYGMDTPNTLSNTNTNTKNTKRKKKAERNQIPPTREMVEAYIAENGYNVDAENFMNFYDSKGWLVGKSKMKDWQAAVRNWHSRNKTSASNPFLEMLEKGEY